MEEKRGANSEVVDAKDTRDPAASSRRQKPASDRAQRRNRAEHGGGLSDPRPISRGELADTAR